MKYCALNKEGKFAATIFMHYTNITIFVLWHFILIHPVVALVTCLVGVTGCLDGASRSQNPGYVSTVSTLQYRKGNGRTFTSSLPEIGSRTPVVFWWLDWHHRCVPWQWQSGGIPHLLKVSALPGGLVKGVMTIAAGPSSSRIGPLCFLAGWRRRHLSWGFSFALLWLDCMGATIFLCGSVV